MPSREDWADDYAECFRGQREGWAVYQPIKSSALKPGMCGYFDIDGIWQTIVDLTNPDDVNKKKLPPVGDVIFSPGNLAESKHWGLRMSRDVKQEDVTADVSVRYVSLELSRLVKSCHSELLSLMHHQCTRSTGWKGNLLQVLGHIR